MTVAKRLDVGGFEALRPADAWDRGLLRDKVQCNHDCNHQDAIQSDLVRSQKVHNPVKFGESRKQSLSLLLGACGCAVIRNNRLNVSSVGFGLRCCRPVLWDPRLVELSILQLL
jgi:hypothetical protein